ncbi:MAG TPA: hypothetical protein VN450_01025, partial [Candidatus Methylomirabilis sp.]|nr:hypothetical protein [Candidatus Methylomirabilis sp.]
MTASTHPWREVGHRTIRFAGLLSLVIFTAFSMGCSVHRGLRLTEIGKDKIELYLDEKPANLLTLRDHRL